MQDKRTVILIDPNVNFIEDLQRRFMLEPEFEIVQVATMGMDGINKVQQYRPHFIVMAHPLPDVDAMQLLGNLNMVAPHSRKIVSLEMENPILSTQIMQGGANYVLTKPYSADKLIDTMKAIERKPMGQPAGFQMPSQPQPTVPPQGGYYPPQAQPEPAPAQQGGSSIDRLRGAMSQLAHQQDQGYGQPQPQPQTMPYSPAPIQPNPYGQGGYGAPPNTPPMGQPMQPFGAPAQMPNPAMNPGYGQGGFDQGFPAPNMGYGQQPDPNQGRMGGFRTIKQTVIAVNCPKGGVGKTTISKELAQAFATVKVNGQPLKVCLVDCDLDFGDVASMLKLNPYPNITHWTSDIAQRLRENPSADLRYTQAQIEQKYLVTHQTGLKVLAAPSNHTDALDITGKEMEVVIDNLKACDFDVIILDTGNNTKDYSLIALDKAHVILMITTLDVTTINDTNMLLTTLRSIQFPTSKIQLVVNRMPKTDKDIDTSEISQVLRASIIGVIPDFPKIRQLNNAGTPAVLGKETEYSAAIRKIANKILPVFNRPSGPASGNGGPARPSSGGKQQSGGGFLAKLFGRK